MAAFTAAGFPKLAAPTKKKDEPAGVEELGYLMFLSRGQIRTLAQAAITAADEADPTKALKAAKVRDLVDRDHSLDIALFGRMVADAPPTSTWTPPARSPTPSASTSSRPSSITTPRSTTGVRTPRRPVPG